MSGVKVSSPVKTLARQQVYEKPKAAAKPVKISHEQFDAVLGSF